MMTPEMVAKLRRSLIKHEGIEKFPYRNSLGNITIGIGYNLSSRGISDEWINSQYQSDIVYFYEQLSKFPWFDSLNLDRKIVLIDMAYNIGWKKFLGFEKMIDYLAEGNHKYVAHEMLNSLWSSENPARAIELARAMDTGVYSI